MIIMRKIWDIENDIDRITDQMHAVVDEETGEITDESLFDAFAKQLDEANIEKHDKLINVGLVIKNNQAEIDARKAVIQQQERKIRSLTTNNDWLKTQYLGTRLGEGVSIDDPRVKISWRKSERVELYVDAEQLPSDFRRIKIEADKTAIKNCIKAGGEVQGAGLVQNQNLIIK